MRFCKQDGIYGFERFEENDAILNVGHSIAVKIAQSSS